MAKAKSTAGMKASVNPVRLGIEMDLLAKRIRTVECTAVCVELALLYQNGDEDEEIARCVQRNIVDALGRLREQIQRLGRTLGGKPPKAATKAAP